MCLGPLAYGVAPFLRFSQSGGTPYPLHSIHHYHTDYYWPAHCWQHAGCCTDCCADYYHCTHISMPIISPTTITRNDGRLADRDRPFNARVSICLCTCLCTCLHMCLYTCLYTGQRIVISTLQMIDQFTLPGPLSSAAAMSTALAPEFRPNADDAATAAAQTSRTRAGQGGLQATTATALRVKRRAVSKRCMNVAHSAHAVRGLER